MNKKLTSVTAGVVLAVSGLTVAAPATAFAAPVAPASVASAVAVASTSQPQPPADVMPPPVSGALKGTDQGPYSVTIDKFPSTLSNKTNNITTSSTGFSDGNWLNVWIRPVGTSTWLDDGGNWVPSGSGVSSSISLPYSATPTQWEVQVSLGQFPNEQYSQIVQISQTVGDIYLPQVTENGIDGQRYLAIRGTANSTATPGSTLTLAVIYGSGDRVNVPVTVGADGSFQYLGNAVPLSSPGTTYTVYNPAITNGAAYHNYY